MTATATTQLTAGTWAIDPVHSSINFWVRHLMVSKVRGKFDNFSGAIVVAEDGRPSVHAEIAVDSVNTGNGQRDAHIKSGTSSTSRSTRSPPLPPAQWSQRRNYVLRGELALKGVTKPVTLDLDFYGVNPGMGQARSPASRHRSW